MEAEKFWDNTAQKYAAAPIRDEETYQEKLRATQACVTPDSIVLELGCGTGTTAIHHAPHVKKILATDISGSMLEIARERAREAGVENVEFKQATIDSFTDDENSFDVVLALNLLHLLEDPAAAIGSIHRLLKPGGVFVSSTACLGDSVISAWRIVIPVLRLFGKAPPVTYLKRQQLRDTLTGAGFHIESEFPRRKGQAAFIICRKSQ